MDSTKRIINIGKTETEAYLAKSQFILYQNKSNNKENCCEESNCKKFLFAAM